MHKKLFQAFAVLTTLAGMFQASALAQQKPPVLTTGFLKFEAYNGITGNPVQNLLDDPKYPATPDEVTWATAFDSRTVYPNDSHEAYGARLSGFVIPTESAQYEFFLRSDDASQLFLSTDDTPANAAQIAEETGCCGAFEESGAAETSAPVSLVAGKRYYVQALWKEGTGGDFCQVAWRKVGDTTAAALLKPIPGAFLGSMIPPQGSITIAKQPANVSAEENQTATFSMEATGTLTPLVIQWQKNGVSIPGGVGTTYTTPLLAKADNGAKYRAVVAIPGASMESTEASLTVTDDKTPPVIVKAEPKSNQTELVLTFSERLNQNSAAVASNYKITSASGTVNVTGAALSADGTKVTLTTAKQPLGTKHTVTVNNVTDRATTPNSIAANNNSKVFFPVGKLIEQNGFIVFEAENYDRNLDNLWMKDTTRGNPSGGASMVNPNGAGGSEQATKLEYDVEFKQAATYKIWFRASGNDGSDDSAWFHIDGERPAERVDGNSAAMVGFTSQLDFVWRAESFGGVQPMSVDIAVPGPHVVGLARREDGSFFDKFILTTDMAFTPSGFGPSETREGAPGLPTVSISAPTEGQTFPAGGNVTLSATAAGKSGLEIARIQYAANGKAVGEATTSPFSFTWNNVPDGIYAIRATAFDEIGQSALSTPITIKVGTPPPQALLVVGTDSDPVLNASDAGVKARLESQGWQVTVVQAPASITSNADGKQLVITSSTVNSGDVGDKFRTSPVPVLNWEQALQDNFLMTVDTGSDHGTLAGQTDLNIVKADHPLAGGVTTGVKPAITAGQEFSWGVPNANAVIIATIADDPTHAVIYGYEKGAKLIDDTPAPARRVMFFSGNNGFAAFTPDGLKLFDAAVSWAANIEVKPPTKVPTLSLARTQTGLSITFTGTLQSADSVTGPWTDVGNATSPLAVAPAGSQKFYRAKQ
ncbi:MAG: Ig-like domain-containing protein [Verrucomicrobia bacterium]|nr:Ig-like domain-containing protein [Verrucomicrobiota bacterium]